MVQSSACCSPHQDSYDIKNKLACKTPTEGSNYCTPVPAGIHALIPAVAPVVTLLVASGSPNSSIVRYLEDDLQRIVGTIFEARPLPSPAFASVLAPVVTAVLH